MPKKFARLLEGAELARLCSAEAAVERKQHRGQATINESYTILSHYALKAPQDRGGSHVLPESRDVEARRAERRMEYRELNQKMPRNADTEKSAQSTFVRTGITPRNGRTIRPQHDARSSLEARHAEGRMRLPPLENGVTPRSADGISRLHAKQSKR